jgi:hypothetical protein
VTAASKKRAIDIRSKKVIFLERLHKMMEEDPSFSKMGKKKQAQTIVDASYSDKMLAGEVRETLLHVPKNTIKRLCSQVKQFWITLAMLGEYLIMLELSLSGQWKKQVYLRVNRGNYTGRFCLQRLQLQTSFHLRPFQPYMVKGSSL